MDPSSGHNTKQVDERWPLAAMTCVAASLRTRMVPAGPRVCVNARVARPVFGINHFTNSGNLLLLPRRPHQLVMATVTFSVYSRQLNWLKRYGASPVAPVLPRDGHCYRRHNVTSAARRKTSAICHPLLWSKDKVWRPLWRPATP